MNDLVQKCSCCSDLFSQINTGPIHAKHKKVLSTLLLKEIKKLKLKGQASLVIIDGLVIGLNYIYANDSEIRRAELVVKQLENRCETFMDKLLANSHPEFYSLAA